MEADAIHGLLASVAQAERSGFVFDYDRVRFSLEQIADGHPLSLTNEAHLVSYLDVVSSDGQTFNETTIRNAHTLLENLRQGRFREFQEPMRFPPSTSMALAIPAGAQPAVDILIRTPHQSLLDIYAVAVSRGVGNQKQYDAIQKVLWLKPLESKDYRLAVSFFEAVKRSGIKVEPSRREQARFLIDMLSPGADPHGMLEHLRSGGLANRIRVARATSMAKPEVVLVGVETSTLDDLLLNLSSLMRKAADDGDSHLLQKLAIAARNVAYAMDRQAFPAMGLRVVGENTPTLRTSWVPKFFEPVAPFGTQQYSWEHFDKVATSPYLNVALMPLGVVEHVLASVTMRELTWNEGWDEAMGALGGSAAVGGTLLTTVGAWHLLGKIAGDEKFKLLLEKINKVAPPRVRSYLIPILILSAFTFMALRETQNLPLDEAGEYRWNFLEEMVEGFGVNLVVTGSAFFGINRALAAMGALPAGKWGPAAILAVASGMGMLGQEIYTSWRRKHYREALKEKTYKELLEMMEALPTFPPHMRFRLINRIDRKFSVLIALNVLEFESVKQAIVLASTEGGEMKPLNSQEQATVNRWIHKMAGKQYTDAIPVSMLPAQKHRIVAMWDSELGDVYHYLMNPPLLDVGHNADGSIPSSQFVNWGMRETMALLRRYTDLKAIVGDGDVLFH